MKRLFAWLLAVVMLLTCFYGCGKAKPQGDEDLSEVFRLTLSYHADRDKEGTARRIPTEEELLALGAETVRSRTEKNFSVEIHGEANTQAFYLAVLEKMEISERDKYGLVSVDITSFEEGTVFSKTKGIYFKEDFAEDSVCETRDVGLTDGKLIVRLVSGKKLIKKVYTPADFPKEAEIERVVTSYPTANAEIVEVTVFFKPKGIANCLLTRDAIEAMGSVTCAKWNVWDRSISDMD